MSEQHIVKLVNRKDSPVFWLLISMVILLIGYNIFDYDHKQTGVYLLALALLFIISIGLAAKSYKATEVNCQLRKMTFVTGFFGPERRRDVEIEPLQYVELFSKRVAVKDERTKKSRLETFTGVNIVGSEPFEFCLLPKFDQASRYAIKLAKHLDCPLVDQVNDRGYLPEEFQLSLGDKLRAKNHEASNFGVGNDHCKNINDDAQDAEMSFALPMLHNPTYYLLALCISVLTFLTWLSAMYIAHYQVSAVSLIIFIWAFRVFLRQHKANSLEHTLKLTSARLLYQSGVLGKHTLPLNCVEDLYVKDDEMHLLTTSQDIMINFSNNKELMHTIHEILLAHFKTHG
ncbi:hypothetical protein [Motilimonas eburnea]|uniref:hypothetical protein n=1 Tax=Motilimonas eburnea TaxID=1737488 RepID=UPI001E34AF6C|nr:hypothetical protein [Motilimonas eburnea]MCE2573441.1 hypothetical protein [Motilimonas eburnea]